MLNNVLICDLCRSKESQSFLITPDRNYETGIYTYIICKKCRLVRLSPRPDSKSIADYYPQVYRPYRQVLKPNILQRIIRIIIKKNKYIAKILIKDQLFFYKDKGRLLDVGPGSGNYLHVLKSWGWDVFATELSKDAVKLVKESGFKNIKQGDLFSSKYPAAYFNAVRYSNVLEHVPSPSKELKEIRRILKKNGCLFLTLPNIDSKLFKIFKSYWYPLEAPRHFYQFSPETISKLLKKQGFKNIKIRYNQSAHSFIWSILYCFRLHNIDMRIALIAHPLTVILRLLNAIKASDILEITAYK